jgi:hypothetical protein
VMSAPWSCGVSTPTFSRTSRNTHVSFTGRSTPVTLGETFCEVKSVSRTGLTKLSRSKAGLARSSEVIRKITSTSNLVALGRRSEWGLRIGGLHLVAYGRPPADVLDARWVSTHLNPPRIWVIITTSVNRHPSLPGRVRLEGRCTSARSSCSRRRPSPGVPLRPSSTRRLRSGIGHHESDHGKDPARKAKYGESTIQYRPLRPSAVLAADQDRPYARCCVEAKEHSSGQDDRLDRGGRCGSEVNAGASRIATSYGHLARLIALPLLDDQSCTILRI